ncbi:MAG: RnfABCDGE type electron transport complex subunit B [Candidatus Woesearchaeota archaeon]
MIVELLAMMLIALLLGISLAFAAKKLEVREDDRVGRVFDALPHSNCGACGFPGCLAFAKAVVNDPSVVGLCRVGQGHVAKAVSEILGVKVTDDGPYVSRVLCKGGASCANKFDYRGVRSCAAAAIVAQGPKACINSCLGFGDCVNACQFGALKLDGLPVVDMSKCNGCGLCVQACPKSVLVTTKKSESAVVRCKSHAGPKENAKNCKNSCIACSACVRACPAKAISIADSLAVIDQSKCNHCGICVKACQRNVIEMTNHNL